MAKEKVSFSKFFPESTTFIVLDGYANGKDDFDVTLKIGDGSDQVTLFATDWYKNANLLKTLQEAVTKAVEFQNKALGMSGSNEEEAAAPKKTARKKTK